MENKQGETPFDNLDLDTKCLRIELTPLEPYFFGTDRTFAYDSAEGGRRSASYFMRSAETPSQTTLFGALRYLGIKNPDKGFCLCNADKARIGCKSFRLNDPTVNNFGMIRRISPLYLADRSNNVYARIPFDHEAGPNGETPLTSYTPYAPEDYEKKVITSDGEKSFPKNYSAKEATSHTWFSIKSGTICENKNVFKDVERVGNDKKKPEDGFFKKVFKQMPKHSFVFFAQVANDFEVYSDKIYLGHGKSLFSVTSIECKKDCPYQKIEQSIASQVQPDIIYAQSDVYVPDTSELFSHCSFVAAQTKSIRVFTTEYGKTSHKKRFTVGSELIRLISAGSVFKLKGSEDHEKEFWNLINSPESKHAQIAGFNHLLKGNMEDKKGTNAQ